MAELRVHLALERASGVLAGIVAALAQKKLELKTQKLTRAAEGRGGSLDIRAEGEADDIAALADHLAKARGVGEVVRIEVDGVIVYFDGAVVQAIEDENNPFTLDDESENVDSELDAFLEPEPTVDTRPPPAPVESDAFLEPDEAPEPVAEEPKNTDDASGAEASNPQSKDDDLGPLLRPIEEYPDEETEDRTPTEAEPAVAEVPAAREPAKAPDAPSSGWGDEELDDWADDVEALESRTSEPQVGVDPEPASTVNEAEAERDSEPESTPEPDSEPETRAAAKESEAASRGRDGAADGASNGADRTAATLRRRRRRRR